MTPTQLAAQLQNMAARQQAGCSNMLQSGMAQMNNAAYLNSLANGAYAPNVTPIKAGIAPPPHRTPEQIAADLEARMAELEAEANKPERKWPCKACAWYEEYGWAGSCGNALVKGFSMERWYLTKGEPELCGPEKALWEPKPPKRSLWARFIDWFTAPWRESVPD